MTKSEERQGITADVGAVYNRIFFRMFQAANTLQKQANKQLGISAVQWAVLGALVRPRAVSGMSVTELADYLVVSRQNLDGVLTRLERENHVERVPDATDKRARRVRLTAEGWAFWNALEDRISEFYRQAMVDFSFDDKIAFAHFMTKVLHSLKNVTLTELDDQKQADRQIEESASP